ncbi:hypothetical protein XOC_0757 [Xanthomonas oryzae pv. oryzicola BLS256]|uniref:Uncharacterized protein n=1 Tax=Xanthomonas oryzae pv. oryzicola (strain BLS256) TaxID=383407 RepID=G7TCH7_XANOB|nr:hypothetical protein XOC_0757 [Xanthomonas oryzae pv. oryzicola BLS256]QEO99176.1 hypothetical protein XOCgx_4189 [Xanthomonas oryzae pv. oryzicola]
MRSSHALAHVIAVDAVCARTLRALGSGIDATARLHEHHAHYRCVH